MGELPVDHRRELTVHVKIVAGARVAVDEGYPLGGRRVVAQPLGRLLDQRRGLARQTAAIHLVPALHLEQRGIPRTRRRLEEAELRLDGVHSVQLGRAFT